MIPNQNVCVNPLLPEAIHKSLLEIFGDLEIDELPSVYNITKMHNRFDIMLFQIWEKLGFPKSKKIIMDLWILTPCAPVAIVDQSD